MALDFLVDQDLKPWLIEINGTQHLAVQSTHREEESVIEKEKMAMIRDMIAVLGSREKSKPRYDLIKHRSKKEVPLGNAGTCQRENPASGL